MSSPSKDSSGKSKPKRMRMKIFTASKSVMEQLINKDASFCAFYNLARAITTYFVITSMINYYFNRDILQRDIDFLTWAFSNFKLALITEVILHFIVICIYFPLAKRCAQEKGKYWNFFEFKKYRINKNKEFKKFIKYFYVQLRLFFRSEQPLLYSL